MFNLDSEGAEELPRLNDKKDNVFVIQILGQDIWCYSRISAKYITHPLESAMNLLTRYELANLIKAAGLDLVAMCNKDGESHTQPNRQYLMNIVEKYRLLAPPETKKEAGIGKYASQKTESNMASVEQNLEFVEDSTAGLQQEHAEDDDLDEELLLNQLF